MSFVGNLQVSKLEKKGKADSKVYGIPKTKTDRTDNTRIGY